ncbi:hypothetical protein D0C36_10885 [Mucilaginibacter conchicola]|uniref:Uncharacterized protein n=1 Tax=Mucilaginibacter conchicola TaxID=2303333 RepID=A0A372NRQ9_9SPHI|nr:hypothetical protein D0C36_10885 [Mucilaginibacter conchicola]
MFYYKDTKLYTEFIKRSDEFDSPPNPSLLRKEGRFLLLFIFNPLFAQRREGRPAKRSRGE